MALQALGGPGAGSIGDDTSTTIASLERNNVKSKEIKLSVHADYTDWEPWQAFRELVQNWRDSIIKSYRLAEQEFMVTSRKGNGDSEVIYEALRQLPVGGWETTECIGYIRFDSSDGTVDISNRNARLEPLHLDLGTSTKRNDEQQAGMHGEGLTIALLTLMRKPQNYSVVCISGGYRWTFNFAKSGQPVARLNLMSPKALKEQSGQACGRPFVVKPSRDVQFIIGGKRDGRDDTGALVQRSQVTREQFDAWMKAALFLCREPDNSAVTVAAEAGSPIRPIPAVISTEYGDLLTTEQLRGRIYLKGFLLRESKSFTSTSIANLQPLESTSIADQPFPDSASVTKLPLRFGYNFATGATNRERQSVANEKEESLAIMQIWTRVLDAWPEMTQRLSDMLNTEEPECADVFWANIWTDSTMSKRLRNYLTSDPFKDKWYYSAEHLAKNSMLHHTIEGLGREGVQLTRPYWRVVSHHNKFYSAKEEEQRLFTVAPSVTVPREAFARDLSRLLGACMRACPTVSGMRYRFVQPGPVHLQLYYLFPKRGPRSFLIHERWLSKSGAIQELGLPDNTPQHRVILRGVKQLFADALKQLRTEMFWRHENLDKRTLEWVRNQKVRLAEQRLLNHLDMRPISAKVRGPQGLRVSWNVSRQEHADNVVEVQCHRAIQCSHLLDDLLTTEDARSDKMDCIAKAVGTEQQAGVADEPAISRPLCRVHRLSYDTGVHDELGLEVGEEYFFVLVNPADPGAIVALSDAVLVTDTVSVSPAVCRARAPRDSFTLGRKLENRDILFTVGDQWYEAKSAQNVDAVIGVLGKGKKRKLLAVDDESE